MTAVVASKTSVRTIDSVRRPGRPGLVERIREVAAAYSQACAAAHFHAEHKAMSNAALAELGLERADLPRATFDRLTQKS